MKKRFLALFLTLALMFGLVPAGVSAAGEVPEQTWSHLTVNGSTATGYCPHCCDDPSETVTWTLLTRPAAGHANITEGGHYFLSASSATNGALQPSTAGIDVVLHLNGQTYKRTGASGNNTGAIRPQAKNTTISIVDDQAQNGVIHGDFGWAVSANGQTGTTVKLYSGNLTSVVDTIATSGTNTNGGTILKNTGTFEMYGGTINGTKAVYGGAINISGATTVNIYGGTIRGGVATGRGGNIYMASTTSALNISGGIIEDGVCLESGLGGGNVYANNGTFTITGGTIRGGKGVKGGNVYFNTATTINGAVSLENGEATYGGNLYANGDLTLSAASFTSGTATYGGNLYVNTGSFTLGNASFAKGTATYGSDIYVGAVVKTTVDTAYSGAASIYCALNLLPDGIYNKTFDSSKISCNGAFSGKLFLENVPGRPSISRNGSGKSLLIASKDSAALVDKDGNYTWYAENDAAVAAYSANTAYMVAGGASLPVTGGDYVIDLAGHDVTITGTGSVTLFDSANADYETYGTAYVNGPTLKNTFKTNVAGNDYYMVQTDTYKYTFHRMGVKLAGVSVRPDAAGMYYTGIWQCDDLLAEKVVSFGVAVSLANRPQEDFAEDGDTLYTQFGKADFDNGVAKTGVIITGILKDSGAQNNYRARQKVYAAAYVVLEDGAVAVGGSENSCSLNSALQLAEDNRYAYAAVAEDLQNFCDTWKNKGVRWDMDFTLTADEQAILDAYQDKTAYQGEAHDHAATEGGSDGNFTLEQWKQDMEIQGLDFTTIVDHHQDKHMRMDAWTNDLFIGGTEASSTLLGENNDSYAQLQEAGKSTKVHYSMIFSDYTKLDEVLKNKLGGEHVSAWRPATDKVNWVSFDYKDMTKAEFQELIAAVKAAGGMFTIVHPKSSGYIDSANAEDYYFADWTGLEVFYGAGGYAPTQAVNKENYKLWTDLLAAGKKVWATAGSDKHAGASTDALTTIYSDSASATDIFEYMKAGNSTCGPVGIRMVMGDTQMGSETDFAGKRLSFSVGDFHESVYNPDHTYRVKLISDTGVVYETTFDASKTFIYGVDAVASAKFYRVEVWDDTAGYDLPIAIGNPIWNEK